MSNACTVLASTRLDELAAPKLQVHLAAWFDFGAIKVLPTAARRDRHNVMPTPPKCQRKSKVDALKSAMLAILIAGAPAFADDAQHVPTRNELARMQADADGGNTPSQVYLGWVYETGFGVTQDYATAVTWYTKAAEQGDAQAQNNLGRMYSTGEGVAKDYGKAVDWFRKAAEQGDLAAESNLGAAYMNGTGVPQNYDEAAKWNSRAAEQGVSIAEWNLGAQYLNGQGVPCDLIRAYVWMSLAADQGIARVKAYRDRIAERLTAEQKIEAEEQLQEKRASVRPASGLFHSSWNGYRSSGGGGGIIGGGGGR